MEKQRATIYLDAPLHKALKIKAAETGTNVSDLVCRAVRQALFEDLEDLRAIKERSGEPVRPFDEFLDELANEGIL